MIIAALLLFCAFLLVLVKSSDYFVSAAARVAKYLGVSEFVIGLTIVSLGTTLPELGTSIFAAFGGTPDLAIGNALGSVVANIGLILGISAVAVKITVEREKLARDCMVLLGVVVLFALFAYDGGISFLEGCACLAIVPVHIALKLGGTYKGSEILYWPKRYLLKEYLNVYHGLGKVVSLGTYRSGFYHISSKSSYERFFAAGLPRDVALMLGLAILIGVSARYMVGYAVEIASFLGIGEGIIGATLIAIGTSLPELSVAISSIRRGFNNIMLGNIIGANILNMTLITGAAAAITPLEAATAEMSVLLPFTFMMSSLLFIFVRTRIGIGRAAGAVFIAMYAVFTYLMAAGSLA